MPEEKPTDDVEKVLSDLKTIEDRKQALIADLLRQKAEAVKAVERARWLELLRSKCGELALLSAQSCVEVELKAQLSNLDRIKL